MQIARSSTLVLRGYSPNLALPLVRMWRTSFEQAVGVVDPHSLEEQLEYLRTALLPRYQVQIVVDTASGNVVGFIAANSEIVAQLYVHPEYQRKGIGSWLINVAKEQSNGRLRLFTFKVNAKAQQFYQRHGFKVVGEGFEEMWQLENLEYEWVREPE